MTNNTWRSLRKLTLLVPALFVATIAQGQEGGKVVPARAELSPLDQPISWLQEAKRNFTAVKDYQCFLSSQERVKGELLEKNVIKLSMKTEPFSVHMTWLEPVKSKSQEVVYVAGRNNGKMLVKSPIFPNLIKFIAIDVNDPRVLKNSRHTIPEAGLGNMIEENLKHWEAARKVGQTKVTVGQFKFDNRDCLRVELSALSRSNVNYCYRSVIYLDKDSKIPIRLENYDFPREGGPAGGDLLELFSYNSLQFNVGLRDELFNK